MENTVSRSVLVIGLCFLIFGASAPRCSHAATSGSAPTQKQIPTQQLQGPAVINAEQLTKQQFTALPDTTVLVLRDGTTVTAGELRLKRRQRVDQAKANSQARGAEAKTWFDANYA